MSPIEKRLSIVGGPNSGKSSYLGALKNALELGSDGGCTLVRESRKRPNDMRFLDQLASAISSGNYPQRSDKGTKTVLPYNLELVEPIEAVSEFSLLLGDYSGEDVESFFKREKSTWGDSWKSQASSEGILLFIQPRELIALPQIAAPSDEEEKRWERRIRAQTSHDELQSANVVKGPPSLPGAMFGDPPIGAHDEDAKPMKSNERVRLPTEFPIIELLQYLRETRALAPGERVSTEDTFRVAVVFTAWDMVEPDTQAAGPQKYLVDYVSLLNDFLWSNFYSAEQVRVFGVSATGGDLKNPDYRKKFLAANGLPGSVEWIDNFAKLQHSTDLSIPLLWSLFGEESLDVVLRKNE